MRYSRWEISEYSGLKAEKLAASGVPALTAALLCARGVDSPEAAKSLLVPGEIHDPFLLEDMDKAVARIKKAAAAGEKVAVYGDYDVDGITSTCLMTKFLRRSGISCVPYIPNRLEEGYGINTEAVEALARQGITLIVTVDCGITAVNQVESAKSLGIDIVITDHHECGETLPDAVAVVDPKRRDSAYPFRGLAGVGVAFKLICALGYDAGKLLDTCGDLVALGTIADVMPMTDENRAFVRRGLIDKQQFSCLGLRLLADELGLSSKKLGSVSVSFAMAPKLNAAGRMGCPDSALELLMTDNPDRAAELVAILCDLNCQRQQLSIAIYDEAMKQVCPHGHEAAVAAGEGWHIGVVGIAASRMSEKIGAPVAVISVDGGVGRGSCRSPNGFNIFAAMESCSDLLTAFGGHKLAVGFTIAADRIDEFRERFRAYYRERAGALERPCLKVDMEITQLELLSMENVESLDGLEPYGAMNDTPVMCLCDTVLKEVTSIGDGRHLRIRLTKDGREFDTVFFSATAEEFRIHDGCRADVAFTPSINEFRGHKRIQLCLCDIRPCRKSREKYASEIALCAKIMDGSATMEERRRVRPDRCTFVRVWRYMGEHTDKLTGDRESVLRDMAFAIGGCTVAQYYICIKIFEELGLVRLTDGDVFEIVPLTREGKADLQSSMLLKSLGE